ncbi:Protein CBG17632 [Caenorhabditis briggsae]|uniref:6-phosphogluconate dehydrogenase, decarboxylating n=1 Tax=Caenorhabditis briggsae TaxID=6238 RepID=A8XRN3_CAEBR|nr:Protein CBG17632 [Caenorhabditis briggsae]CAP35307.1 Protein CBG17632 [Caenorhabditis briggsae]
MAEADIAVIGLAVMGQNLILNMNDHGFTVCAFNRTTKLVDDFLANEAKGTKIIGAHSIEEMCKKLKRPRRVMMLIKAGDAVDSMINQILPFLEKGDIIIDGGNSDYNHSNRRYQELKEKGISFVGCGVSGGEEGARFGPSLMPGGDPEAWPHIKDIFQKIAAKSNGEPCCDWVGNGGSGHFVKMVHNGIEYGDMQLIAEAFNLLSEAVELNYDQMAEVMDDWNKGELESFLIEITANILKYRDEKGEPVVPKIRDSAGQKGTGKWTCIAALEYGLPVTLIGEAVFARCLSALKEERVYASEHLSGPHVAPETVIQDKRVFIKQISKALYASKIVSYAQGFMLLAETSKQFNWDLNFGAIALMWRGGCIIRSRFLGDIKRAFDNNKDLPNLLLDAFFTKAISEANDSWRVVVGAAIRLEIPVPAFSSALAFYDGYKRKVLPANLLQALRDYFGAHTYELLDQPGTWVHTNWTGKGGRVTSNTYNA